MRGETAAGAALCVLVIGALARGPLDRRTNGSRAVGYSCPTCPRWVGQESGLTARREVVGLWQAILWADGYTVRRQLSCTYDGPTAVTTRAWRSNHHLAADGTVGPATWGTAAARLASVGCWAHRGQRYHLPLRRDADRFLETHDAGVFRHCGPARSP